MSEQKPKLRILGLEPLSFLEVTEWVDSLIPEATGGVAVQTRYLIKRGNRYTQWESKPTDNPEENLGWEQAITVTVAGGAVVMHSTPGGLSAEMSYIPGEESATSKGEVPFTFIANEIDLGKSCSIYQFVQEARVAVTGIHQVLLEAEGHIAHKNFSLPHILDYSLGDMFRSISDPVARDKALVFRIDMLINTRQWWKALRMMPQISSLANTRYKREFIEELVAHGKSEYANEKDYIDLVRKSLRFASE